MKILVVSSYYQPAMVYGGPVQSIHLRNKAVSQKGCEVIVYTTAANGLEDFSQVSDRPVLVDGIPVTYFPRWWFGRRQKPFSLFFSPALAKALRQLKPGEFDLILLHANWADPGRLAAAAARRTGTPYICYTHGTFEPWAINYKRWKKTIYFRLIEGRILQHAAGIVVCNLSEAAELSHRHINTPCRRIPWGVDLSDSGRLPERSLLKKIRPELIDQPFILSLSRLHPKKGLDLLLPAFGEIKEEFPAWHLVVAGPDEGGYLQVLERLTADLGLVDRVFFPGLVTGEVKAALLAHTDLFVLPSYSEGFPMAVSEALGCGRPLIITQTCYVPEVAQEGAGLEIPPTKEALVAALRQLLSDAALRQQCGRQALAVAQKYFTWEAVAEQSLAFYREVMSRV